MKHLTFIVTLLSLLIASALLVIAVRSCAPNAHAGIRAEWIPLPGTEGWHVNAIETDGRRLYAATWEGGYISDLITVTPGVQPNRNTVLVQLQSIEITSMQRRFSAAYFAPTVTGRHGFP